MMITQYKVDMDEHEQDRKEELRFEIFGETYEVPYLVSGNRTKERILVNSTVLFLKHGYGSVSMRDIADSVGIQPSSLYSHFASKDVLWAEALSHAIRLYMLYFRAMDEELRQATSFRQVIETIFLEPKRLSNTFTCYAFSLLKAEQFRENDAAKLYNQDILRFSIEFFQDWFDRCIARGYVRSFDTETAAIVLMNSILMGLDLKVQELMGRKPAPYDPAEHFRRLERYFLMLAEDAPAAAPLRQDEEYRQSAAE
ncbi:MAG: TetR/AcrR family transcriptional regulator [Planctomycetes bacterium]|nr:TetR/AcrR family transcriptional regulator [Planctomycetota bacterium]